MKVRTADFGGGDQRLRPQPADGPCRRGPLDKLHVVHCGVDPAAYPRARYGTPADTGPLRLVTVGPPRPVRACAPPGGGPRSHAGARTCASRSSATGRNAGPSSATRRLGVDGPCRFHRPVGQDEIARHYDARTSTCTRASPRGSRGDHGGDGAPAPGGGRRCDGCPGAGQGRRERAGRTAGSRRRAGPAIERLAGDPEQRRAWARRAGAPSRRSSTSGERGALRDLLRALRGVVLRMFGPCAS